jgi:uncharacterized protein (TIGR00255 family)
MRSMTGYGAASHQRGGRSLTVEVRAVNQRFLEAKLNMPREYVPWEAELRGLVQAQVARGKVDVSINRGGSTGTELSVEVNEALATAYLGAWRKLQRALKSKGEIDVSALLARPDVLRIVERRPDPEAEIDTVRSTLRKALLAFNRDREREGKALSKDMLLRARRLRQLHAQISKRVEQIVPDLTQRLRQRVSVRLEGRDVNEERLLQEVALVAERSDVTEELVRLDSHLTAFTQLLQSSEPIGKRLDFLLQEIHREFNTIASKSADLEVTNGTIEARAEIEKLKEQTQNVE